MQTVVWLCRATMAAMYLYGGCPHPLAKLPRNLNKPVPASGDAALTRDCSPQGNKKSFFSPLAP